MKRLTRRILIFLPACFLQFLWVYILVVWLLPWAVILNLALSILAFFFVLYLITKQDESTYKILWLLIILTFPIIGALLYLFFGNKRTTRPLRKKIQKAGPLPPDNTDTAPLYEALSGENKRLAHTFQWIERETGFVLHENRTAKYYPLGDDMFPDILTELKKAERFIFVEYFILQNGLMWDSITEILVEKAAQGVDVRVLYDDFGSLSTYTKWDAEKLREKGIRCVVFNPIVYLKGTVNYRDHRKMLIVDGKTVFSGGINLSDEYINHVQRFGHWKDIGFMLKGEAVGNYVRMFTEFWNAFAGEHVPDGYLSMPKEHEEKSAAGGHADTPAPSEGGYVDDGQHGSAEQSEKSAAGGHADTPAPQEGGYVTDEEGEFAEKSADGYVLSYYDSPLNSDAISNELFIELLSQAQESAWFYTPYLVPGNALLDTFVRAARRGVDVRIILPGIPDKKVIYRMSRSFYSVLVDAGVKIYEYTPGFVHAKGCIVDGEIGTVGSVNLDYRSLFLNFENNSLFYRASMLDEMKADFLATQEKCKERTKDTIGTGFIKWIVDGVLRILAPLC